MGREGRKRLAVDIPVKLHEELKRISGTHHCTITMVVVRFLVEKSLEERIRYESEHNTTNSDRDLSDLLTF